MIYVKGTVIVVLDIPLGVGVHGITLQAVHETGDDERGWKADEEVDVIVLPVELGKFTAEVLADVGHDLATTVEHRSGERPTPVLGDEHQVDVAVPNCVPALANLAPTICHTNMLRWSHGR